MSESPFVLITREPLAETNYPDREGGEQHGGIVSRLFGTSQIPADKIESQIGRLNSNIDLLLRNITKDVGDGLSLAEIEVGIAIEASGTIGIVSAGMEASVTLRFARR